MIRAAAFLIYFPSPSGFPGTADMENLTSGGVARREKLAPDWWDMVRLSNDLEFV